MFGLVITNLLYRLATHQRLQTAPVGFPSSVGLLYSILMKDIIVTYMEVIFTFTALWRIICRQLRLLSCVTSRLYTPAVFCNMRVTRQHTSAYSRRLKSSQCQQLKQCIVLQCSVVLYAGANRVQLKVCESYSVNDNKKMWSLNK